MLSPRELQIAELISKEYLNKQIADELGIAEMTVKNHLRRIVKSLGVKSRVGVAVWYVKDNKTKQNSMTLSKKQRKIIYDKYGCKCAYCGCLLPLKWHADHIEPIVRDLKDKSKCEHPEREDFKNYNPSCPSCNILKNSISIESFRGNIGIMLQSLNNYSTQYKMCKKYGLVSETGNCVVFYFEKFKIEEQ